MKKLLFINACMRGKDISRTYKLAAEFLANMQDRYQIETLHLNNLSLHYLNAERIAKRDDLIKSGMMQSEELALARQFASADRIVIAAPFWDLGIPAALKVYIENVSVHGLAFRYDEHGVLQGLCRADKLLFIMTCGGRLDNVHGSNPNIATPYIRSIASMCGIKYFECLQAQELDIQGIDAKAVLQAARQQLIAKSKEF